MIAASGLRPHPRILLDDPDRVRRLIGTDERAAGWYARYRADADRVLHADPVVYSRPDGKRLLAVSRELTRRAYSLALAAVVSGEAAYRERLWLELSAVCAFPDWNPSHFLDVAEMAHGVAIGYDWLYEQWSDRRRDTLRDALVRHALQPGLHAHTEHLDPEYAWTTSNTNWNLVCNGGLTVAALAVGEAAADVAEQVLAAALASMPAAVRVYSPDGAYPEGQGYWSYATRYLVFAAAAYTTATGRPDPLTRLPGVRAGGLYAIHMTGPRDRAFNYYDGPDRPSRPPELFWLARQAPEADASLYSWWAGVGADTDPIGHEQLPTGLLWYEPGLHSDPVSIGTDLDACFRRSEVVSMRSAWLDPQAVWLAAKGGDNATAHADLDLGTFVLEALGQRWICDFGSDDYNLPGYFDVAPGGARWSYYRKRTEGHNTLLFAADHTGGQSVPEQEPAGAERRPDPGALPGTGRIIAHASTPAGAFAVADLSMAAEGLLSWRRGWRLFDQRRQVLVHDEFRYRGPTDVWSFLHTRSEIRLSPDRRAATLSAGGARLIVRLLQPSDAAFQVMDARPLPTSPSPPGQATNAGVRKLAIHLDGVEADTVCVQLTPLRAGAAPPEPAEVVPLADWLVS